MPRNSAKNVREITVAHSPDSDDAFMFYGMATNKIRVPGVKFTHTLCDIETLNRKAMDGFYDITAISFHAYPYLQDKYALMPSGGSVGEGYGPMIVASRNIPLDEIGSCTIAVPGTHDHRLPGAQALRTRHRHRSRALRRHHSQGARRGSTKPGSSFTRASLPSTKSGCTGYWTWASGGASRPVCRCRLAATPFAASSAPS